MLEVLGVHWGPRQGWDFEAGVVPSDLASLLSGQGFHGLGRPPESLGLGG